MRNSSGFGKLGGNLILIDLLLGKGQRLHLHEVDTSLEIALLPHRDLDGNGIGAEVLLHLGDHLGEIRAGAVHLVHKGDARHAVLVGLVPDRLTLWFHATHGTEHRHHTVDYTQGTLHLDGEIHVSGSVYQVDLVTFPLGSDGG